MRFLFATLLATCAVAPARAIPISEASGSSTYSLCTGSELSSFYRQLTTESADCILKSGGLSWESISSPTTAQREKLCSCKKLLQKLPTVSVPHCLMNACPYAKVVDFEFGLCNTDGSPASGGPSTLSCGSISDPTTTAPPVVTTTRPPVTTDPPTRTTEPPTRTTEAPVRTTEAPDPDPTTNAPVRTTEAPDPDPTTAPITPSTSPVPTSKAPDNDVYTYRPVTYTPTPVDNTSSNRTATVVGGSVGAAATIALTVTIAIRCRIHCAAKRNKKRTKKDGIDDSCSEPSTPRSEFKEISVSVNV